MCIWIFNHFYFLDHHSKNYWTYRCTDNFIGTNCMLLLITHSLKTLLFHLSSYFDLGNFICFDFLVREETINQSGPILNQRNAECTCPTKQKRSICISDFMCTTFFYNERFLKILADGKYSSMSIQPFITAVDWPEIGCLMEVSTLFHICRYCVFAWWDFLIPLEKLDNDTSTTI